MLIIKRFAGESIVVETAWERYEIVVLEVRAGVARMDVGGKVVDASKGLEIVVTDSENGELLIIVDQVGMRGIRLGFKGAFSRKIYRKESTRGHAGDTASPRPALEYTHPNSAPKHVFSTTTDSEGNAP